MTNGAQVEGTLDNIVSVAREEFVHDTVKDAALGVVEKPLTKWERVYNFGALRKLFIILMLAAAWQAYAMWLGKGLLLPTLSATANALWVNVASGELLRRAWYSISVLLMGYGLGIVLAGLFTAIAISSRLGSDFLETMTSMLNPLPAIALLPLALIWFGLGNGSMIFVLVHSVLWPVALNAHAGFRSVSNTLRMVGRNAGLRGARYIVSILIPAASGSILSGLKIGWAFAWRTLIAAELVFGATSNSGGLGWFIYVSKNELEIANVFAGLLTIILIGLFVENVIFRNIELITVKKWGMQN